MKLSFDIPSDFLAGAEQLAPLLGYEISYGGITVKAKRSDYPGVSLSGNTATIYYKKKNQFFRGIGHIVERASDGGFELTEDAHFDMIGVML